MNELKWKQELKKERVMHIEQNILVIVIVVIITELPTLFAYLFLHYGFGLNPKSWFAIIGWGNCGTAASLGFFELFRVVINAFETAYDPNDIFYCERQGICFKNKKG